MRKIITSESVNIGHPDKTCDTIADAFLDAALKNDPNAQMAVECAIKDDLLMIYGEATTTTKLDYASIASKVLKDIGYDSPFRFVVQVSEQSPEINKATVQKSGSDVVLAANDQGIVYGYACNETPEFMPMPIMIAHALMKQYDKFRRAVKSAGLNLYFPDAKSQVSIEYENDMPVRIHTILISVSHDVSLLPAEISKDIADNVIKPVLSQYKDVDKEGCTILVNPSGAFTVWGSHSDSGCVGRKIIVDTYGGVGRHGGGAFSSKNATKIDRSAAYYARYVAKNIVAKGMADRAEVSASYAIGLTHPLKVNIETFGTAKVSEAKIYEYVAKNFDFKPANIIKELDLLKPIYQATACFGHFGRNEFSWEKIKRQVD